jgi:hypothetical protein
VWGNELNLQVQFTLLEFSVLGSRFSVLGSCSGFGAEFEVLGSGFGAGFEVRSSKFEPNPEHEKFELRTEH